MIVNKRYTNRELFEFFQSRLPSLSAETANKYRRTITDLDIFITGHRLQLSDISAVMIADFTVELLRRGLAKNTVVRHLNILNSLLKSAAKRGLVPANESPRIMARKLSDYDRPLPFLMNEEKFTECLEILRKGLRSDVATGVDVYLDMLLFSLLNGGIPLRDVAMLKKSDVGRYNDISRGITERNMAVKREFVFDLKQSYSTPKQIYKTIGEGLKRRFGELAGLTDHKATLDPDSLARSIWVAITIKSGATASEALICQGGNSAAYALPEFCTEMMDLSGKDNVDVKMSMASEAAGEPEDQSLADENKTLWVKTVNAVLTHDMPRWYAMHLRKGVDYSELLKDIAENIRPVPELFYPSETIKKRVGKKTVIDEKPFISRTVFFKSYPEKILPMFSCIGDKAWCYRVTRSAGSPYAVISSNDMRRFQSVIGVFTPDIEIHTLGELTPKPGESVIVIKAGYGNRKGEIDEVLNTEGGSVIFRVKLSTDQGYEWRVDLDPHQIERLR